MTFLGANPPSLDDSIVCKATETFCDGRPAASFKCDYRGKRDLIAEMQAHITRDHLIIIENGQSDDEALANLQNLHGKIANLIEATDLEEIGRAREEFIQILLILQGDKPNILATILAERMEIAKNEDLISGQEGDINLAGFVLGGAYAKVRNRELPTDPGYYGMIEDLSEKLFPDIFEAIFLLERKRNEKEAFERNFPPTAETPKITSIEEPDGTIIECVRGVEFDQRTFFDRNWPGGAKLPPVLVGQWLNLCGKPNLWVEGALAADYSRSGQFGIIRDRDHNVKATAWLHGRDDLERWLTLSDFCDWPIEIDPEDNLIEKIKMMLQQGCGSVDTSPLDQLDLNNLRMKALGKAILACRRKLESEYPAEIPMDEFLRLTLDSPSFPAAYWAIQKFCKLRANMGIVATFGMTETYPFRFIFQIVEEHYNALRKKEASAPVHCCLTLAEKKINNMQSIQWPTDIIYFSYKNLSEAMALTDPDLVKRLLTKARKTDKGLPFKEAKKLLKEI